MDHEKIMKDIIKRAGKAASLMANIPTEDKDRVLLKMAEDIGSAREDIKKANSIDIDNAVKKGKNRAFIDRLELSDKRIDGMCDMLREVAGLDDPVGDVLEEIKRPNGLVIKKVRVPIGVIGIIYESRPNVTADCVSLCLKSGNVVILRGGSDAINSNKAIYDVLRKAASDSGFVEDSFILMEDTSRELVDIMLRSSGGIDLIMPRGGESLIRDVVEKSRVPVIKHYKGICHIYVDDDADLDMAEDICINAKVQRPGVCNAMETMLVNRNIADSFLPGIISRLKENNVRIKGCGITRSIVPDGLEEALDDDYATEWLDLVLNIKVVNTLEEAVTHISRFGSNHSDAIITDNKEKADKFTAMVDSSAVYVNASTRFTDGGEFGKGAEIGISTDKLHARGPMGIKELTAYKYVIHGNGQVRT